MTKLFVRMMKKKNANREQYGILSGVVCIVANLLLCVFKFMVGKLSGSISITADALNNLSDMASNTVTIAGTKLSSKPVDEEHPFGHGRMEYISALAVSGLIFVMGFELAKSSVEKIIHPQDVQFSYIYLVVLGAAILVKLWMAFFNNKLFKITDNINLKAVKQDSLNDSIATFATMLALVLSHILGWMWIDGAIGLGVAVVIFLSGIDIVKDIIGPLLGQPPEKELVESIERIMLEEDLVIGVHDLIVHDYGPGRIIASAHAEVPSNEDVMELHDVIDNIEVKIMKELNIVICIHLDPVVVDDEELNKYKELAQNVIKGYNEAYSFHDFRMVKGPTHTNLIFDLIVPHDHTDKSKIIKELTEAFRVTNPEIFLVVKVEHSFV